MPSRRDFVKKSAYVAPLMLSLNAAPSFASTGSARPNNSTRETLRQELGEYFSGDELENIIDKILAALGVS